LHQAGADSADGEHLTMPQPRINRHSVTGWGIDANPRNDPTYPIKQRTNGEHEGYAWQRPPQQPATCEILHSNERPNLSAAFGTAAPLHGLSGLVRRFAFRYSESNYGHWLPLMLADRIAVFEGICSDLAHFRLPNFFTERGGRADWRYNRAALIRRTLIRTVLLVAVIAVIAYGVVNRRR
jgi:hypothetical protein